MFGGTVKLTPTGVGVIIGTLILVLMFYWGGLGGNKVADEHGGSRKGLVSLKELLAVGVQLAEKGGDEVRKVKESAVINQKSKGKTKEGANDPMTDADLFSHRVIVDGLSRRFAGVKIISEEYDAIIATASNANVLPEEKFLTELKDIPEKMVMANEVTIWVDPLDATQEFTENLFQYVTTMICIAIKGRPVIGIINKPFGEETVWGWVDVMTSSNLKPNIENSQSDKERIIVSRSHAGLVRDTVIAALGNDTEIVSAGGAGYKVLQLISGKVDAYVHITTIKKWDLCAANAILNSVGGSMTTLSGKEIDYDSLSDIRNQGGLLATMKQHEKYLKLLKMFDSVS